MKLPNIHPGEILAEEFLTEFNISAYRLAKETKMPLARISGIIKNKRRITVDTALRLAKFFGTSAEFWLGLQFEYDLREERGMKWKELDSIRTLQSIQSVSQN